MAYEQSFSALCSSTRGGIFETLLAGPLAVGQLAKGVPVSRAAVSQHLKILWEAGVLQQHREGRQCLYEIDPRGLDLSIHPVIVVHGKSLCRDGQNFNPKLVSTKSFSKIAKLSYEFQY